MLSQLSYISIGSYYTMRNEIWQEIIKKFLQKRKFLYRQSYPKTDKIFRLPNKFRMKNRNRESSLWFYHFFSDFWWNILHFSASFVIINLSIYSYLCGSVRSPLAGPFFCSDFTFYSQSKHTFITFFRYSNHRQGDKPFTIYFFIPFGELPGTPFPAAPLLLFIPLLSVRRGLFFADSLLLQIMQKRFAAFPDLAVRRIKISGIPRIRNIAGPVRKI